VSQNDGKCCALADRYVWRGSLGRCKLEIIAGSVGPRIEGVFGAIAKVSRRV
jgi:hypothetical protein